MSDTKKIVRADLDEIVEAITSNISMTSGCEYCEHEVDVDDIRTALERFVVEDDLRSELIEYDTWSDDNYEIEKKPHERVDKYLSQRTIPKKGGDDGTGH